MNKSLERTREGGFFSLKWHIFSLKNEPLLGHISKAAVRRCSSK